MSCCCLPGAVHLSGMTWACVWCQPGTCKIQTQGPMSIVMGSSTSTRSWCSGLSILQKEKTQPANL